MDFLHRPYHRLHQLQCLLGIKLLIPVFISVLLQRHTLQQFHDQIGCIILIFNDIFDMYNSRAGRKRIQNSGFFYKIIPLPAYQITLLSNRYAVRLGRVPLYKLRRIIFFDCYLVLKGIIPSYVGNSKSALTKLSANQISSV